MSDFESFHFAFKVTLNKLAPLKQKLIRNNNQPFMTKTLRKAIMKRSKLRNKFNKERNIENWSEYKRQRNLCSNLLKESKKRHFNNLNVKDVTENKQFWRTKKPFFTEKSKTTNNIILTENNQTMREDRKICQIFNTYFTNITKDLKLRQVDESQSFENEESCRLIRENYSGGSFSFKSISKDDIIEGVKKLPSNKASISNDIPITIIKSFVHCYCEKLTSIFNDCLEESKFPNLMKIAEITPVFKKLDNTSKDNYRPVSTLSNFTKLFESLIFTQLNRYMQNKFSKYLTGFWKNHNTQNSLFRMIESWKVRLNNGSKVGVIIMDLSKAFDSLNHKLLITKLKAYGLDSNSVTFMKDYLTNRLQRCKINNSFSGWEKVLKGVPQGSILGPLLFNIFINDIFLSLQKCDLANYADDSTLYTSDKSVSNIMNSLSHDFTILSQWFYNNFMVLNPDKCSFMLLGVDDELQTNLVCGNETLKNSKQEKVVGVTIDNKLNFKTHLLNITKNANIKFNALTRVQKYMTADQKKCIFSSFIKSQFTYFPLLWMFCTKHSIGRINSINERCQRLIQQNFASDFEVLLENANEKQVHQKCIELLMIEIYKYLNGLSPDIMNDIFKLRENTYNLKNFHIFESENPRTKRFGLDCIAYRASQLWKNVPVEIRNSNSLTVFKEKIKKVPLIPCSCNCRRKYIHHVGFI